MMPDTDTKAESEAIALAKAWRARRSDFFIATHGASNRPAKVLRSADETAVFGPASVEECEHWIDEQCARAVLSLSAPHAHRYRAGMERAAVIVDYFQATREDIQSLTALENRDFRIAAAIRAELAALPAPTSEETE